MKYRTCSICGNNFPFDIDHHYISRDCGQTGLAVIVKKEEEKLYDTYDCPFCGCQNIIQERKRSYFGGVGQVIEDNEDDEEEEDSLIIADEMSEMDEQKFAEIRQYISENIKQPEPVEPYETRRDGF